MAAGAAVIVTWRLGRRQALIAHQQAQTALDRLRYDLFEKRYAIYAAAMDLMRMLVNEGRGEELNELAITEKLVVIEECVFFYPKTKCDFFSQLRLDTYSVLELRAMRSAGAAAHCKLAGKLGDLAARLRKMPEIFESTLGFPQLTRRSAER